MRQEIEILGGLVDAASEIEIGLAELAQGLEGEARETALRLEGAADRLADALTAVYIELAKQEAAQERAEGAAPGSTQ